MTNTENQEIMSNFIKKNISGYNEEKSNKDFENYKQHKSEELIEAKNNSKYLSGQYRRYQDFDNFKANVLASSKTIPIFIFIGITFVVAMYNILTAIGNSVRILFKV